MKRTVILPPYRLAIFDETDEQRQQREEQERQRQQQQQDQDRQRQEREQREQQDRERQQREQQERERERGQQRSEDRHENGTRDDRGRFANTQEYEQRIHDLNEENATRRRENRDLSSSLTVLQTRLVRADALEAVRSAGAVSDRVADLFLADMGEQVTIDKKTGATVGLDKLAEWKKSNAAFFKAEEGGGEGGEGGANGGQQRSGGESGKENQGGANGGSQNGAEAGKRGNATARGTSQGGSGEGGTATGGLPDLSELKTPEERKAAIDSWKRTLSGAGAGYGRASSKK